MTQDKNSKVERVLALVEPGRRDAMRRILATAAYAAPVIASFSLDAEAQVKQCLAANQTCFAANQTYVCGDVRLFSGTVKCKGMSLDTTLIDPVAQPVNLHFADVTLELCEGATGVPGGIAGGPATLAGLTGPVFFAHAAFGGEPHDTLGFAVHDCQGAGYHETGQWTHSVKKDGTERIRGKSHVLVVCAAIQYTLECEYDLRRSDVPV